MDDIRITNSAGDVALQWALSRPAKPVKIDGTETVYVFTPRHNVWMAWVKPEHVDRLLAFKEKTCNCNSGTYKNAFKLATRINVNLWEYGDRHGKPEGA